MYCFQKNVEVPFDTLCLLYIFILPSPPALHATDFPNIVPLKFGPGNFLVIGVPLVHCNMFSSIPALYPLDASGNAHQVRTTQNAAIVTKPPREPYLPCCEALDEEKNI